MNRALLIAFSVGLAACASAESRGVALTGARLERALSNASAHPLGSRANPVRSEGLAGSRAYLARLRCANGAAPRATSSGSASIGPFGSVIERYEVVCDGGDPPAASLFVDTHHGHIEAEAPPGFAILP